MRRGFWGIAALIIFVVLLVGPVAARWLQFYSLSAPDREAPPVFEPAEEVPIVVTPAGERFTPTDLDESNGRVLLDMAHDNSFTAEDISYLDDQLAQRGFDLIPFEGGSLQSALRSATAFVIMTPLAEFTQREITTIKDYVERGGRLLLIGDPTRFQTRIEETEFDFIVVLDSDEIPLNGVANEFDLSFNGDYAFNVVENEGNFRNIIFSDEGLRDSPLTEDLEQLVLYGTHTLDVGDDAVPLLVGDDDTSSSIVDRPGGLIMAAASDDGRVLALGDINFLTAPYYTTFDNGAFIARLADFLVNREDRRFVVGDFPFFFGSQVNLIYTGDPGLGPDIFDEVIVLQDEFNSVDIDLTLSAEPQEDHDVIYLGLYNQAEEVAELLDAADIELVIDPPLDPEDEEDEEADENGDEDEEEDVTRIVETRLGRVEMSGTALILLDESNGRRSVVVLAASGEGLTNVFERLLDLIPRVATYALEDCLLEEDLALCPTGVAQEPIEAELETGGAPAEDADSDAGGEEDDVDPDDEDGTDDGGADGEYNEAIDAVIQGTIGLGETVEGTLAAEESHGWLFDQGPVVVDVTLLGEAIDAVIEIYDENDELVTSTDSAFSGEAEQLRNVEMPAEATYTIVARDFFGDPGDYELSVVEGVGLSGSVLIISDDSGVPQSGGFTGADEIAALLESDFDVLTWSTSEDGALNDDLFTGVSLVIWASGDYRREDGLDDNDVPVLNYLDGGGSMIVIGATPPIYEPVEVDALVDLEVADESSPVIEGFEAGEVLLLDQSYDAAVVPADELFEGGVIYLLRGSESAESGAVGGFTFVDEFSSSTLVVLLAPFPALPEEARTTLLTNMISFTGLQP